MQLTVRVHHDEDSYWAEVVELPGCFAAGDTLDELTASVSEAVALYLSDDDAEDDPAPAPLLTVDEIKMLVPSP